MAPRLRIATWNCYGTITSLGGFLRARPRWPQRLASPVIARALAAWDVVCVQENFLPYVTAALDDIAHTARMAFWYDRNLPEVASRSVFGGGLALLARHPPASVQFTMFDGRFHGFDGYATKGYAVARFEPPDAVPYHVVNTHLQADDPLFGTDAARAVRAEQLAVMLDALDPDVPTVIAGDLNVPYGSHDHARVLAPLLARGGWRDHAAELPLVTWDPSTNDLLRATEPNEPGARLDYILSRGGRGWQWAQREVPRLVLNEPLADRLPEGRGMMFPSDHYGLGVVLQLVPADTRQ